MFSISGDFRISVLVYIIYMRIITDDEEFQDSKHNHLIKLQCYICDSVFEKPKNQVLANIKANSNGKQTGRYCSSNCLKQSRMTGKVLNCKNCNKIIYKNKTQFTKSPNHFCSQSCSATYSNHLNPKRSLQGSCILCSKVISTSRNYCKTCFINSNKERKEKTILKNNLPENRLKKREYMKKTIKSYVRKLKKK